MAKKEIINPGLSENALRNLETFLKNISCVENPELEGGEYDYIVNMTARIFSESNLIREYMHINESIIRTDIKRRSK